jgi:hypothetical protein
MKKLLPLLLVLLVATIGMAQNKGKITGTVTTADGAVIQDVNVTISSDALIAGSLTLQTNDRGMYRFVLLPVGTYQITFAKEGYKTVEQTGLQLGFDSTLTIDKVLAPSEIEEVITITGESPVVDKTSSTLGDKLDTEYLQNTPSERDVWSLPNLTAGFTNDSSLGAISESGQAYNTDGVNVSDPSTGTLFSSINMEAVEQVDVNQFGAQAEYGAFTGASLNVVTKSGGNEFSGEVNYFAQRVDWVDDNTEEYDTIAEPTASDLDEFNFALGGPVIKDKIWFFANYHHSDTTTQFNIIDGTIDREQTPRRPFIKLSARWDDRNMSTFSYTGYERDNSHRPYLGGFEDNYEDSLWIQSTTSDTFLIQHSLILTDDIIVEGKYAGFQGEFSLLPRMANGTSKPLMWDSALGQMLPGSSANRGDIYDRDRNNFVVSLNYFNDDLAGSHSFKFGFEYENSPAGRYFTLTDYQLYWLGETYVRYDLGERDGKTKIERYAGYAQDSWSVNDNLTLNIGFRVDSTALKADDPDSAPIGDDDIYSFNDPAYRLGFAYDIFGDGKTVLRGFAGRYYEGVVAGNTESFVTQVPPEKMYYGRDILGPNAPEWTLWSVTGGTGNVETGEDMENMYSEGIMLGVDHEIMENLAGSVTFIYRKDNNALGEINPTATWDEATANFSNEYGSYNGVYYPNYNSGGKVLLTTIEEGLIGVLDEPYRNYMGLMFEINKRMSDNWSLKASYTYSRNEGTLGQGYGGLQGYTSYSDPNTWVNADGRAGLDRPHQFKASGTYIAPYDIFISPVVTYYSGTPWTKELTLGDTSVWIEERDGSNRHDNQLNVDLRVEKAFLIMDRYRLGFIFDAFNLFNDDSVTGYKSYDISSSNYLVPSSVVDARFYQFGVRLLF